MLIVLNGMVLNYYLVLIPMQRESFILYQACK